MDTRLRQAIARIDVTHVGGSTSRGTGFLVATDLVLTAFHVVADRHAPGVSLYPGRIALTFPTHVTDATVVDGHSDPRSDWILLRCVTPPPDVQPIPLANRVEDGAEWETFGFPEANPRDGMVMTGTVEDCWGDFEGVRVFQLYSKQAAAGDGAPVKGLSGGPVIVQNTVVGLLRVALWKQGRAVAGTLYGCPIKLIHERCDDLLPPEETIIDAPPARPPARGTVASKRRTAQLLLAAALVVALLAIAVYRALPSGGVTPEPRPTGVLLLTAVLTDGGEALSGVAYEVYTAARDVEGRRKHVTKSDSPSAGGARFALPAGRYFVTAAYGITGIETAVASASAEVEVTPAGTTQQILNLRAGILRLTAVLADRGEALSGATYEVYTAAPDVLGNRKHVTQSDSPSEAGARFALPAGRYFVTAAYGITGIETAVASASAEVEVTPAGTTQQILNLRAGILRLTAVLADRGEALSGVTYGVYTAARDVLGNRKHVTQSDSPSAAGAQFALPAGRYFVTAAHSGGNASAETVVAAGGAQDVQLRIAPVTKR